MAFAVAAIIALLAAASAEEFVRTPGGGLIHPSCIHSASNVSSLAALPPCEHSAPRPQQARAALGRNHQIYAMDVHAQKKDFWTSFTASWTVPALPKEDHGQTVYFWPGFKSQQPEMGLPVLQPVMQFGQGFNRKWQLQSWYVHAPQAITAKAIALSPGDVITSYMSYDAGSAEWTVSATNTNTGEDSTLTISKQKLGGYNFDWAMLVCETIKQDGQCASLPADDAGLTFTNVTLDGGAVDWTEREGLADCAEAVKSVDASGDQVKMTWSYN